MHGLLPLRSAQAGWQRLLLCPRRSGRCCRVSHHGHPPLLPLLLHCCPQGSAHLLLPPHPPLPGGVHWRLPLLLQGTEAGVPQLQRVQR